MHHIFAFVTDAFGGHGGMAKFNRDMLTALCSTPGVADVVALPSLVPAPPGPLPEKLQWLPSGLGGKWRYGLATLRAARRYRHATVILCGHIHLLPMAFVARCLSGAPLVLVIHGIEAWRPPRSWLVNRLLRWVDAVVAVSAFTQHKFLAWSGATHAQHFLLPNCVELSHFSPGPRPQGLLERYGLHGHQVMLTVARLSAQERYKGIDEVLEVMPALRQQMPTLRYLIVGDGTDRARLEHKATECGVRDSVIFAGRVTQDELVEHYRLADVFVMPGYGEGFGIVYLEALACGLPVVASAADASGEVVQDCPLATVVDPRQPQDIHDGICRALMLPRGVRPPYVDRFATPQFHQRVAEILMSLGTATPGRNARH